MAKGFRRAGEHVEMKLGEDEAAILARLFSTLDSLLEAPPVTDPLEAVVGLRGEAPPRPEDPALARLMPDVYPSDPQASADYRRRNVDDALSGKRAAVRRVLASVPADGGWVSMDAETADAWLRALTDLRLVIATRLGLTDDESAEELHYLAEDDPRRPAAGIFMLLFWLQDGIIEALSDNFA